MSDGGISQCRSCGGTSLWPVLDLGSTPIANALVDPQKLADAEPRFPLAIIFCSDCTLVQLAHPLPAEAIFDEEYPYYSSFSDALMAHAASHVATLIESRDLGPESLAVEIASNDGYLLRNFVTAGIPAVGIEPSPGPAGAAEAIGVPTIRDFFGLRAAMAIRAERGPADVLIANNVMAHVPDLNDFVAGLAHLLADGGLLTVENPYVRDLIEHVEFDTIYHEHYCYYSCSAVEALMGRHGLHLNDVEYFPTLHGGTLRWHIGKRPQRTDRCEAMLADERARGLTKSAYYERFAARVRACQDALRALLESLRADGRRVAAYGAAAKGATLLNSTGLTTDHVAYVVDRNVHKQGLLMPGCRLPIRPVETLLSDRPDDLLILAWNFMDEIVAQQQEYADRGGTFYVPVPVPRQIDR